MLWGNIGSGQKSCVLHGRYAGYPHCAQKDRTVPPEYHDGSHAPRSLCQSKTLLCQSVAVLWDALYKDVVQPLERSTC